jgi:hypothetical protein
VRTVASAVGEGDDADEDAVDGVFPTQTPFESLAVSTFAAILRRGRPESFAQARLE